MKKEIDVLLLGYYGFGNLGDELLAEAALSLLKEAGVPSSSLAILSASPTESEKKFGVRAFNRWKISEVLKSCRMSRTLLLGGGGLFQDSSSVRSSFYYLAIVLIARLVGAKVWAEGQSVGPLRSCAARFATKAALYLCSHIGVRDETSQKVVRELGFNAELTPDLLMSRTIEKGKRNEPIILFNARPGYEELSRKTAECCRALTQSRGLIVRGIALSDEDAEEIKRLKSLRYIDVKDIITVRDAEEFSNAAACASYAVGMRLHFLELCRLAGIPAVGCAYDPKVSGFCLRYNIHMIGGQDESPGEYRDDGALTESAKEIRETFSRAIRRVLGDNYEL